jgi:hypothetical protein
MVIHTVRAGAGAMVASDNSIAARVEKLISENQP